MIFASFYLDLMGLARIVAKHLEEVGCNQMNLSCGFSFSRIYNGGFQARTVYHVGHTWPYMKVFLRVATSAMLLAFPGERSGMLLNSYNVQYSPPSPNKELSGSKGHSPKVEKC